jgi:hypothetical protein
MMLAENINTLATKSVPLDSLAISRQRVKRHSCKNYLTRNSGIDNIKGINENNGGDRNSFPPSGNRIYNEGS